MRARETTKILGIASRRTGPGPPAHKSWRPALAAFALSLSLSVVVLALGVPRAAASTEPLSEQTLLTRLTDPAAQLKVLPAGLTVSQLSSTDLTGGNQDGGSYDQTEGTVLPPTFVRTKDGAYVLADERGPGCLLRMWMTASTGGRLGDPGSFGNLQMFFDGSSTPAVDEPASEFFAGKDPRFPTPLVNSYLTSSGGNYSYIPFCFAHRLEIRVTGSLSTGQNYFQLTFLHAPPGIPLQTFDGNGADLARVAVRQLANTGRAPSQTPTVTVSTMLGPGRVAALAPLKGRGAVKYLQIAVKPFDIATLNALSLRVAADSSRPQVDVPLANVFGDGIEVRPIRSLAFGMDPATGTGYLSLPIPYSRRAGISIASSTTTATVTMRAWTRAPTQTSEYLYGQRLVTQTKLGQDFPVLQASGSGHLASYVMDVADANAPLSGYNAMQWFMEGDERVYVDGMRSPSIYGTGTEDQFNGGYYFNQGPFTLPLNGAGPLGQTAPTQGGTQSAYRIFEADGAIWSDGIDYSQQAGGNNEQALPETASATTFSYRGPQLLVPADSVQFGHPASEQAHHLAGRFTRVQLDAYFEGKHDGTLPASTLVFGGTYYPSPPPQASNQSLSAQGIAFRNSISVTLRIPHRNTGVVLRRLQDQATPAPVAVAVDGREAGVWPGSAFQGNSSKRWLESDYELPPRLTAGRTSILVTLSPANVGETATAYSLQALSRRSR